MSSRTTRLLLVRHGHTDANGSAQGMRMSGWTDHPLSADGRAQALRVASRVRTLGPRSVYTSPLARARATAAPIAAALEVPPCALPALREIYCGDVEGRSIEHVRVHHAEVWARNERQDDDRFRWPGGESYRELRARSLAAVREIAARHRGDAVVVVTHAGVISQVVGWISGLSAARWGAFRPQNGSLTIVDWDLRGRTVVAFDGHVHLDAPPLPTSGRHAG